MAGAHGLVVRVEDVGVGVVEGAVAGGVLAEDERLEEPRHVGPVPLRRAHVGHRLDGLVLCAQDRGQPLGRGPNPAVGAGQIGRRFSTGHFHEIRPFATPPGAVAHAGCTVPVNPTQRMPAIRRDCRIFHAKARFAGRRCSATTGPCPTLTGTLSPPPEQGRQPVAGESSPRGASWAGKPRDEVDAYRAAVDWLRGLLGRAQFFGVWSEPGRRARHGRGRAATSHAVHRVGGSSYNC